MKQIILSLTGEDVKYPKVDTTNLEGDVEIVLRIFPIELPTLASQPSVARELQYDPKRRKWFYEKRFTIKRHQPVR